MVKFSNSVSNFKMDSNSNNDHDNSNVVPNQLSYMMHIPKVEIDKFDGNPLEYQTFMVIFDEMIDGKVMDGQVKLTRLLQYTLGMAKSSIKNCALVSGEFGYNQARDILKMHFGNSHLVAQKLISDLKAGKRVVKPNEIQLLADELKMATTTLQQLGMFSEVGYTAKYTRYSFEMSKLYSQAIEEKCIANQS